MRVTAPEVELVVDCCPCVLRQRGQKHVSSRVKVNKSHHCGFLLSENILWPVMYCLHYAFGSGCSKSLISRTVSCQRNDQRGYYSLVRNDTGAPKRRLFSYGFVTSTQVQTRICV